MRKKQTVQKHYRRNSTESPINELHDYKSEIIKRLTIDNKTLKFKNNVLNRILKKKSIEIDELRTKLNNCQQHSNKSVKSENQPKVMDENMVLCNQNDSSINIDYVINPYQGSKIFYLNIILFF